jgi:hypothetical protein
VRQRPCRQWFFHRWLPDYALESAMRVDIKTQVKKQEGLGIGFLIAFACLCAMAYVAGGPTYSGTFPLAMERGLVNFRTETDKATEGIRRTFSATYTAVAGR